MQFALRVPYELFQHCKILWNNYVYDGGNFKTKFQRFLYETRVVRKLVKENLFCLTGIFLLLSITRISFRATDITLIYVTKRSGELCMNNPCILS